MNITFIDNNGSYPVMQGNTISFEKHKIKHLFTNNMGRVKKIIQDYNGAPVSEAIKKKIVHLFKPGVLSKICLKVANIFRRIISFLTCKKFCKTPLQHKSQTHLTKHILIDQKFDSKQSFTENFTDRNLQALPKDFFSVDHNIKVKHPIYQDYTGRCTIASALNMLQADANLDQPLSMNFVNYWDKLDRAEFFCDKMIELKGSEPMSRELDDLLIWLTSEGLHWEFVVNAIKKHGIVPDSAMPDTPISSYSYNSFHVFSDRLKKLGAMLHQLAKKGASQEELQEAKSKGLANIKKILDAFYGTPPATFKFQEKEITPKEFSDEMNVNLDDYVHVTNLPYREMNKKIRVERLGNNSDKDALLRESVNISMEKLKEAIRNSIEDGHTVSFESGGCNHHDTGVDLLSVKVYNRDRILGLDPMEMTKEEELIYRIEFNNHMMLITGCDNKERKRSIHPLNEKDEHNEELLGPLWQLQDSRDEEPKFLFATDQWIERYLIGAIVHKKYLPTDLLESEPVVVPFSDPCGSICF